MVMGGKNKFLECYFQPRQQPAARLMTSDTRSNPSSLGQRQKPLPVHAAKGQWLSTVARWLSLFIQSHAALCS